MGMCLLFYVLAAVISFSHPVLMTQLTMNTFQWVKKSRNSSSTLQGTFYFLQCHLSLTFLHDFSTQKIRVVAKRQLQNSLAEKEWIAGWILVGDHLVKDNERLLGYQCTIIRYLNHIEPSKRKVWSQFLTTLSIGATLSSKVIEIKSCFEHLFIVFFPCTASAIS